MIRNSLSGSSFESDNITEMPAFEHSVSIALMISEKYGLALHDTTNPIVEVESVTNERARELGV